MANSNGGVTEERVNLSVERLRTELATMELRLVDRFEQALEGKADRIRVHDLANRLAAMEKRNELGDHLVREFLETQKDVAAMKRDIASLQGEKNTLSHDLAAALRDRDQDQKEIESLKTWRNRLVGGALVFVALGGPTLLRVWFGIG